MLDELSEAFALLAVDLGVAFPFVTALLALYSRRFCSKFGSSIYS